MQGQVYRGTSTLVSDSGMADQEMGVTDNNCSQQHAPMPSSNDVDQKEEVDVATVAHPS